MRQLFLILLLLPSLSWAQNKTICTGTGAYVLARRPNTSYAGELSFRFVTHFFTQHFYLLTVKNKAGEEASLMPADLSSFRILKRRFITLPGFQTTNKNLFSKEPVFAEVVDSGHVLLLRYFIVEGKGSSPSGHEMVAPEERYLLRTTTDSLYYAVDRRKQFREALLPQLTDRPDLIKVLDARVPNNVVTDDIPAIVHAFNTGQPYTFPLTHYDLMLRQAAARKAQKTASKTDTIRH